MATNRTQTFAAALNDLEASGKLDEFLTVFADDAELSRPQKQQTVSGSAGARSFWRDYLGLFDDIRSDFRRVVDAEVGVLEWVSAGRLRDGSDIEYAGVSLLEFDDAGKVTRFATYYDTSVFTPPPSTTS